MQNNDQHKQTPSVANDNNDDLPHSDRLVDLHTVANVLGICSRTVHRLVAAGEFPPPAKVGRASRWFRTDIDRYMAKLNEARNRLAQVSEWQCSVNERPLKAVKGITKSAVESKKAPGNQTGYPV